MRVRSARRYCDDAGRFTREIVKFSPASCYEEKDGKDEDRHEAQGEGVEVEFVDLSSCSMYGGR